MFWLAGDVACMEESSCDEMGEVSMLLLLLLLVLLLPLLLGLLLLLLPRPGFPF